MPTGRHQQCIIPSALCHSQSTDLKQAETRHLISTCAWKCREESIVQFDIAKSFKFVPFSHTVKSPINVMKHTIIDCRSFHMISSIKKVPLYVWHSARNLFFWFIFLGSQKRRVCLGKHEKVLECNVLPSSRKEREGTTLIPETTFLMVNYTRTNHWDNLLALFVEI